MADFVNEDIIDFDNDASASSFGWNFQANAGIFLFLHYIDEANSLKIESKLQDIEIVLKDIKPLTTKFVLTQNVYNQ